MALYLDKLLAMLSALVTFGVRWTRDMPVVNVELGQASVLYAWCAGFLESATMIVLAVLLVNGSRTAVTAMLWAIPLFVTHHLAYLFLTDQMKLFGMLHFALRIAVWVALVFLVRKMRRLEPVSEGP